MSFVELKKNLLNIPIDNFENYGEDIHTIIHEYLSPFINKGDDLSDQDIEEEINAIRFVIDALKDHPALKFSHEDYFETVFLIKNTKKVLTINAPYNVIENGCPSFFEYKIKSPEDVFLLNYDGSWQKDGLILSIREFVIEVPFRDKYFKENILKLYASSINEVYNAKDDEEFKESLDLVFDIFSTVIERSSFEITITDSEIGDFALIFYQMCSFVKANKEIMKFSTTQLPIYINDEGQLRFHNVVENQSLESDIDYTLDLDANLSFEEHRLKAIEDTISFISVDDNFEKSLLSFDPLNVEKSKSIGEIEETHQITFSQMIFYLYCYLSWKKRTNPDIPLNSDEIIKPIFDILDKSDFFEKVNLFSDNKNSYYKIKDKDLGIIISFDKMNDNTFQTYNRLYSLLDNNGDVSQIVIKQRYSIPFEELPFMIMLIEHVRPVEYKENRKVDLAFEYLTELVENFEDNINSNFNHPDLNLRKITSVLQKIFVLNLKDKFRGINYEEIAYALVKFHQIIKEETSFSVKIDRNIFLKDKNDQFIFGNPIVKIN